MITADVAKVEDCKRIVDETISHFGRRKSTHHQLLSWDLFLNSENSTLAKLHFKKLVGIFDSDAVDHLVNNAGIHSACLLEDSTKITDFRTVMVITSAHHTDFFIVTLFSFTMFLLCSDSEQAVLLILAVS